MPEYYYSSLIDNTKILFDLTTVEGAKMENIEGRQIIVIGGAGFVGSHLCDFLHRNNTVLSIDNYLSGLESNHIKGVTYLKGSSFNISTLAADFSPDIIFFIWSV